MQRFAVALFLMLALVPAVGARDAMGGIFAIADLSVTVTDSPDPVTAGANLTYTVSATNIGPDAAASASFNDALPAGTTFVSLSSPAGWSCTTPAIGGGGTVSCSTASFAVGSATFTLVVNVGAATAAGTVLNNTATITSATAEGNPGDESSTASTTVAASADLSATAAAANDVTAGEDLTYTLSATNAGPSNAASVVLSDTLPAGTTFLSLTSPAGWSCTTPAVGAGGTVGCSTTALAPGTVQFTLVVHVPADASGGTTLQNTATVASATSDPNPGNEDTTAATDVSTAADLSVTASDSPDPATAGDDLTYTLTATNAGPSNAASVSLSDPLPPGTTFVSLSSPGGWSCTTPAVGAGGTVTCTASSLAPGTAQFTLVVNVDAATPSGTVLTNTATISSPTSDPDPGDESATAATTISGAPAPAPAPDPGDGQDTPAPAATQITLPALSPMLPFTVPAAPFALPRVVACPRLPRLLGHSMFGARMMLARAKCYVTVKRTGRLRPHRRNRITGLSVRPGSAILLGDVLTVRLN